MRDPTRSSFRSTTLSAAVVLASEVSGSPHRGTISTPHYDCYSARDLITGTKSLLHNRPCVDCIFSDFISTCYEFSK